MIHTKINRSLQVDQLSDFAKLLFTWTIPHLDDFGKIEGDPKVLKATVMPLRDNNLVEKIEEAIGELINAGLVIRYEVDGKLIIAFPKFDMHQSGGLGNRTISDLPDPKELNYQKLLESNRNYAKNHSNRKQLNRRKDKEKERKEYDKPYLSPMTFTPTNERETMALQTWQKLEPNKPWTFENTYLPALKKGLPIEKFEEFTNEILALGEDVENRGALFNWKTHEFFNTVPKKYVK